MMHRQLAGDYKTKPSHPEIMIRPAAISTFAKRATGETIPTWRDA